MQRPKVSSAELRQKIRIAELASEDHRLPTHLRDRARNAVKMGKVALELMEPKTKLPPLPLGDVPNWVCGGGRDSFQFADGSFSEVSEWLKPLNEPVPTSDEGGDAG